MWLLRKDEPVTIIWSGPTVDMPGGSSTDSTGKSPLTSTLVTPRAKAAVQITLLEPNGLSAPDSALERWYSTSRSSASVPSQATLKPKLGRPSGRDRGCHAGKIPVDSV